jgi:hypothetical protein
MVATDFLWQRILGILCNSTVLLNQPDFTGGVFNNILVIIGEAKMDSSEIPTAIAELIKDFIAYRILRFPALAL